MGFLRARAGDWSRLTRANPMVLDVALAVFWGALGVLHLVFPDAGWEETPVEPYRVSNVATWVLMFLVCAPIAWRRSYPLTAFVVSFAGICGLVFSDFLVGLMPFVAWLLLYSVAAHSTVRRALIALGYGVAGLTIARSTGYPGFAYADVARNSAIFAILTIAGLLVASSRHNAATRLQLAEQRALVAAQLTHTAVVEERLRLAQELHDIVAHSMSVISVQASMGMAAFDQQPEQTRRALANVERSSREALAELRGLLGVLRGTDGARVDLSPAPSLRDVGALVANVERSGLSASLTVDDLAVVPPGVDAFGYRIVQEALTNVLKHANASRVQIAVRHEPGVLVIEVRDDGRGPLTRPDADEAGHGILGMHERVAAYGGTLSAAPAPAGGFAVVATLPYIETPIQSLNR